MRTVLSLTCVCAAVLLSGCLGASENPREGGLFGYNPEAYEQRREARLRGVQHQERSLEEKKARTAELEQEKKSKEDTVARQKKQLNAITKETAALSRKLKERTAATEAQQTQLNTLRTRVDAVSRSSAELAGANVSQEVRQAEVERLRKELDVLEQESEALLRQ